MKGTLALLPPPLLGDLGYFSEFISMVDGGVELYIGFCAIIPWSLI